MSRITMKIKNSVLNVNRMNEYRALFKNMYGKLIPRLSCFVTNELTEHSHTSMTIQNPAHLIGRGTVACKEDNGRYKMCTMFCFVLLYINLYSFKLSRTDIYFILVILLFCVKKNC